MLCNENVADLLLVPCCHVVCQKCNNKLQPIGKSKFSLTADLEQHCYFCKKAVLTTKVIAKKVNQATNPTGNFGAWNNITGSGTSDPLASLLGGSNSFGTQDQGWSPLNRHTSPAPLGGFSDPLPSLNANASVFSSNSSNTNAVNPLNNNGNASNNGNVNYNLWNSAPFENSLFGSGSSSLFPPGK